METDEIFMLTGRDLDVGIVEYCEAAAAVRFTLFPHTSVFMPLVEMGELEDIEMEYYGSCWTGFAEMAGGRVVGDCCGHSSFMVKTGLSCLDTSVPVKVSNLNFEVVVVSYIHRR